MARRAGPLKVTVRSDGTVTVPFDTVPIEMPELFDRLVLDQFTSSQHDSLRQPQKRWLFPGRHAGRHLAENLRKDSSLAASTPAVPARATMLQLAAEIPTPILGELLGLSPNTATRWATLAARDWSQYAAMRRTNAK